MTPIQKYIIETTQKAFSQWLAQEAKAEMRRLETPCKKREYRPNPAKIMIGNHGPKLKKYQITIEQLAEMKAQHGGICAICLRSAKLVIDHDHQSGKVRALLCGSCNSGLGFFKDNPKALRAAIEYLDRHGIKEEVIGR